MSLRLATGVTVHANRLPFQPSPPAFAAQLWGWLVREESRALRPDRTSADDLSSTTYHAGMHGASSARLVQIDGKWGTAIKLEVAQAPLADWQSRANTRSTRSASGCLLYFAWNVFAPVQCSGFRRMACNW